MTYFWTEVAIWEETESVHSYAFDDDYDPFYANKNPNATAEEVIQHREQSRIKRFDNLTPKVPSFANPVRSNELLLAFKAFAEELTTRHPESNHHLVYSGHGGPGGNLFEVQLLQPDVHLFLEHWQTLLGQKLGVIDMGGPCNKSGWSDLKTFCQYADYYIASDLLNGGYNFDEWTLEKFQETEPELQYHRLFADPFLSFEEVLKERLLLTKKRYEYSKQDMITNSIKQASYLYSCTKVASVKDAIDAFLGENHSRTGGDLIEVMKDRQASDYLLDSLKGTIIFGVDNQSYFPWDQPHHGVIDW